MVASYEMPKQKAIFKFCKYHQCVNKKTKENAPGMESRYEMPRQPDHQFPSHSLGPIEAPHNHHAGTPLRDKQ